MYSTKIALAATCCCCYIIHFVFTNGQQYGSDNEKSEKDGTLDDQNSFVALIDIMFTDSSKRTCTGTIVHDNVVITAAHCFYSKKNKNARAELSASFVVIGTKHLFETGYEQYLPIERIVTHPKFQDWTADLALVFTFAGMTSDKPGTVIPLAGERSSTPVDSNVTVISWGYSRDAKSNHGKDKMDINGPCSDSASQEKITEHSTVGASLRAQPNSDKENFPIIAKNFKPVKLHKKHQNTVQRNRNPLRERVIKQKSSVRYRLDLSEYGQQVQRKPAGMISNRYLSIVGEDKSVNNADVRPKEHRKTKKFIEPKWSRSSNEAVFEVTASNIEAYYKNWRRNMGALQNKLNVGTFGFVNMQTCKRFLENAVPDKYQLNGANDVVCYSTEGHYITDKDSGAPVIRQGRLIAVTIGGIEYEGDHVAIGMKMNCYCSWIIDNLPQKPVPELLCSHTQGNRHCKLTCGNFVFKSFPLGSPYVSCCKNCCDIKHEDGGDKSFKLTNKYI